MIVGDDGSDGGDGSTSDSGNRCCRRRHGTKWVWVIGFRSSG